MERLDEWCSTGRIAYPTDELHDPAPVSAGAKAHADVVAADLALGGDAPLPPWRSATTPPCVILMVAPGTVAPEAAAIRVPVLLVAGERDVVPDLRAEPKAYPNANDITLFQCPRMAHMHNFASTRDLLWTRLHSWGAAVAAS